MTDNLPTPETDPNGIAGLVAGLVSAVALALGFTDVVAAKWSAVAIAVVSLAAIVWARLRTWSPAAVWLAALDAKHNGREEARVASLAKHLSSSPDERLAAHEARLAALEDAAAKRVVEDVAARVATAPPAPATARRRAPAKRTSSSSRARKK